MVRGNARALSDDVLRTLRGSAADSDTVLDLQQLITLTTVANAYGTFTLSLGGQTTSPVSLALTDTAAMASAIQAALENLSTIGTGNVRVSYAGSATSDQHSFRVSFQGARANANIDQLTIDSNTNPVPNQLTMPPGPISR